jgi:predicted transcriptional regulator
MSDESRVTVRIDKKMRDRVVREAVRTNKNASRVIREAIRSYLEGRA